QARFTETRLANDQHHLPVALARPVPTPHQYGDLLVAADEGREVSLAGAASATACPGDPEQGHRLRHAFELMAAAILDDEKTGDLALHLRGHHDRARLCERLHPRR